MWNRCRETYTSDPYDISSCWWLTATYGHHMRRKRPRWKDPGCARVEAEKSGDVLQMFLGEGHFQLRKGFGFVKEPMVPGAPTDSDKNCGVGQGYLRVTLISGGIFTWDRVFITPPERCAEKRSYSMVNVSEPKSSAGIVKSLVESSSSECGSPRHRGVTATMPLYRLQHSLVSEK